MASAIRGRTRTFQKAAAPHSVWKYPMRISLGLDSGRRVQISSDCEARDRFNGTINEFVIEVK
jgi:hypothetical protein